MHRVHPLARLALLAILATGCRGGETPATPVDPVRAARDQVLVQLSERAARIVDFSLKGQRCLERCDGDEAFVQDFSVQVRNPGLFRIETMTPRAVATFDGTTLVQVDHQARTVQRIAVAGRQDEAALAPYQALSAVLVEGWRAPLLAQRGEIPARLEVSAAGGPQVVLVRPLDDSELERVEYWHRVHKADFVKKRFVHKGGQTIREVLVDREHTDPRTGYSFPAAWTVRDASGATSHWTRLTEIQINAGVPRTAFDASAPAEYSVLP